MPKVGRAIFGYRECSLIEELDERFGKDHQSAGHSLFRTSECSTEVVDPLGGG